MSFEGNIAKGQSATVLTRSETVSSGQEGGKEGVGEKIGARKRKRSLYRENHIATYGCF